MIYTYLHGNPNFPLTSHGWSGTTKGPDVPWGTYNTHDWVNLFKPVLLSLLLVVPVGL